MSEALVLGVDPGLASTGIAVIRGRGGRRELVRVGVISTSADDSGPSRLAALHQELLELVGQSRPEAAAVEQLFFASNSTTAMQVAEARGVILLAMAQAGIPVWEYTPMQVKTSLTGYGKASKQQMAKMVRATIDVRENLPDDAFDAIAVALCHLQSEKLTPSRRLS